MRTAGLPSPTATLQDMFGTGYTVYYADHFYIFEITNAYPSFPSTGFPQQQQQNNKASIKISKGIKRPAKRPALLPKNTDTESVEIIFSFLWKPSVYTVHTMWACPCGWMADEIPTVTYRRAVDAVQVKRACVVTATTEIKP